MHTVDEKLIINELGAYHSACKHGMVFLFHTTLALPLPTFTTQQIQQSLDISIDSGTFLPSLVFYTIPVNLLRHVLPCHFVYVMIFLARIGEVA